MAFLLVLAYTQRERIEKGQNDFTAFYAAAHLAGTPDLYSRQVNLDFVQKLHGFTIDTVVYIRAPFYAAILKPLASFPYLTAFLIYSIVSFSCFAWFVVRFSRELPALPYFAAFSIPVLATLSNGQDTTFLLAILGAAVLLRRQDREFAAGLLLSLCAIKFHLFLFVPVALLLRRRWRILAGGLCGTLLLTALGMAVTGPGSILAWIGVLRDPRINAAPTALPNIHGLVAVIGGDVWLEAGLVALVCACFLWIALRASSEEFVLAASLLAGLLVSFHSGAADDVLLFAVVVLVCATSTNVHLRAGSALLLTPLPYFMLYADRPYNAALPVMLLACLGMCAVSLRSSGAMELSAPTAFPR